MVALLAFIGFYIFGICCYKVCTGFVESTSTKTKKPNTNPGKFRIKTEIVNDKMDYLVVKGFRSYFKGVLGALSALVWWVFDVKFSITDYLF